MGETLLGVKANTCLKPQILQQLFNVAYILNGCVLNVLQREVSVDGWILINEENTILNEIDETQYDR